MTSQRTPNKLCLSPQVTASVAFSSLQERRNADTVHEYVCVFVGSEGANLFLFSALLPLCSQSTNCTTKPSISQQKWTITVFIVATWFPSDGSEVVRQLDSPEPVGQSVHSLIPQAFPTPLQHVSWLRRPGKGELHCEKKVIHLYWIHLVLITWFFSHFQVKLIHRHTWIFTTQSVLYIPPKPVIVSTKLKKMVLMSS